MSRLISLLTRPRQQFAFVRLASNSNKCVFTSSRLLASDASSAPKPPATDAKNELDKPQWERNDRFKIFYGFDAKDEAVDKGLAHLFTFLAVVGFLMVPSFLLYFYPDYKTNDWCYREAHLELARREKAGEPLVSPDYVPADQINLPSEEDLGDMEIVI